MKKLLSLLVALCMALTGITALAEDAAPEATQSNLTVQFDHDFITAYAGVLAPEGTQDISQMISTILDLLESAQLSIVETEDSGKLTLSIGETSIADLSLAVTDDTITAVSSLFPHYALKIDQEALSSMVDTTVNGTSVTPEEMEALLNDLMLYVNDLVAYSETFKDSAVLSEDGTSATLIMTSHHVAEICEILYTRLTADTVLRPYLEMSVAQQNTELPEGQEPLTLEAVFAQMRAAIDELKNSEAQQIAEITAYVNEDGSTTTEADCAGAFLITVDQYTKDGAACTELMCIINDGDPTQDWQSVYDGIFNGTNTDDIIVGINTATAEGETSGTFYIVGQGMNIALYAYDVAMAEETTGAVVNVLQLALDLVGEGNPVAGIQIVTGAAEAPAALSLEGLTVIDLATATEEQTNALTMDITSYGLPSLLSNAQTAAPDQVAQLIQFIMMLQQPDADAIPAPAPEAEPEQVPVVPETESTPETVPAA